MYLTFSKEIKNIPFIDEFLENKVLYYSENISLSEIDGVIGWGQKKTAKRARNFAKKNKIPYISLEDGFICSYGLRVKGYPPLSIIVDPVGIYYDATRPSLLENLINEGFFDKKALLEAEKALKLIVEHNISKFNYQPDAESSILKGNNRKKILVIDQTFNDLSVILGMADKETFLHMLNTALSENPEADIYVKIHPDVICGKKNGYLNKMNLKKDNVYFITQDVNSLSLLKLFDKIYTVSSQMGFEALLLGKPVVCFGMPFYAGWGLTEDKIECARRRRKTDLIEIFYAAYIAYCRYINPVTGKKGTIFDVINFILKQRDMVEKIGKFNYYCVDFHLARKKIIKPYLKTEKNEVYFIKSKSLNGLSLSKNSVFIVWGCRSRKNLLNKLKNNITVYTLEDGFIRSVGLGSEFVPPMSIVIDRKGIYYDPTEESELEFILNNYEFSEAEINQASKIRKLIVENNITKYNIEKFKDLIKPHQTKKIILVPGQVEDDEAVILGGINIRSNLEFLKIVRDRNPDSFIIYKPHPDVLSKNRKGDRGFREIREICDYIETEANIISCINIADEVHTLTSLAGFDALMRDKKVFTYGAAFYAGWGLTIDELKFPIRKRKLSLNELIAGVLLIYPVYYDWQLKGFVDCETIINRILFERIKAKTEIKTKLPKIFKKIVNYFNFIKRNL